MADGAEEFDPDCDPFTGPGLAVSPYDVTVVVCTFGSDRWRDLAEQRAVPSAWLAGARNVLTAHSGTLANARNAALDDVETKWIVYLDADDQLEAGYLDAMCAGTADVRAPSVRYVHRGRAEPVRVPRVWGHSHACVGDCLQFGNWIIIGAMARVDVLRAAGGWRPYEWSEDWAMWAACWQQGATFETIIDAVYRADVRPGSRNRQTHNVKMRVHRQIAADLGLPIP